MKSLLIFAGILIISCPSFSQKTCTSNPTTIGSNINFGSIVWTAGNGATTAECNDMADGLITFTGNVIVDVANSRTITITNDVNINGDFPISGGPGSTLTVDGGHTLYVTGDLGDAANNGVQYRVVTSQDKIIVDGTLYGKNNNAFTGDGSISGGTLDVKNGSTCGSPCPVTGGFDNCTSDDSFCTDNEVLPIVLLEFTGMYEHESVYLRWSTTMEEDFDKFQIERSGDGITFAEIGEMPGAGKNIYEVITRYSYKDSNPVSGLNYYRLKALDLDLKYDYSDVIAVRVDQSKKLSVQPNPVTGVIHYIINFSPSESDRIGLYNQASQKIVELPVAMQSGSITLPQEVPPGIYILKYVGQTTELLTRVVVK